MTHWINVEDVPQGRIFLSGGDKWLMLAVRTAINMNGEIKVFDADAQVHLAPKGSKITIKQA